MTEGAHRHEFTCWEWYAPCGEHHLHDYNCGGGGLAPACPLYEEERGELIYMRYLRRRARELERENVELRLRLDEARKEARGLRSQISYMRGDDQYDI